MSYWADIVTSMYFVTYHHARQAHAELLAEARGIELAARVRTTSRRERWPFRGLLRRLAWRKPATEPGG
jgi:hypothetical protein